MKTAQDIVRSLQVQPQFQKLQHVRCIHKILSMFLPSTQRFVDFCYIKNTTLFVVLNHNAGKQEFDNSIKMIKDVLNHITPDECKGIQINDIKAFVTHKPRKRKNRSLQSTTAPVYKERAKGDFQIREFQNPTLKELFLSIQEIIKSQKDA
ncbi:MAG: hypothetical protein GXO11_01480 [Epsilonproteobacteria bacterium]|nr:hypothetical protein [Campylobacterota bacterium]